MLLLAAVLIVALVVAGLLSFYPQTSQGNLVTESVLYWKTASPVAVIEAEGKHTRTANNYSVAYWRVKNNGRYPIRLTKILGNGQSISGVWDESSLLNISSVYYLMPGQTAYFGDDTYWTVPVKRCIRVYNAGTGNSNTNQLYAARTACRTEGSKSNGYGYIEVPNFGFEYIEYINGQEITKTEIGSVPLRIGCTEPIP